MKKFLPIAMAAVMSMSAVAVSAVSANAVEPLKTPVQYAQVARASLSTPKISKAESVYGGVKLTWNKVNGAAKYRVYYKGRKGWTRMVDTTSTSYIDKDVSSGRNYTYTVRCISADGKSFTSGYDSKGTSVKYVAAPEISKLESVNGGVKISWGKVSGATKYRVYYKGSKGWTRMVDTTSTSYIDKDVSSGRNYTYTVRCITSDAKKFTSGYNPTGKSVKYVATPKISKTEVTYDGVKLTWNKVAGAEKYRVYYKDGEGWNKLADTTGNSYLDMGLVSRELSIKDNSVNGQYIYTVRCISSNGKAFQSGYDSKGSKANLGNECPQIVRVDSMHGGITVSWTDVCEDNSKYRIYVKEKGSWKRLADTTNNYYTHNNVKAGQTYTYTVRCVSKDGKKFTSTYNPSGVTFKYKTTDKTRDAYIDYLLKHESEWLPELKVGNVALAGVQFADLDFDGVPELIVQEAGDKEYYLNAKVYTFKDGKFSLVGFDDYRTYIPNQLTYFYDKSAKKYIINAVEFSTSNVDRYLDCENYTLNYDGTVLDVRGYSCAHLALESRGLEYHYYNNTGRTTKQAYNATNMSVLGNCVNAHMYSQFVHCSVDGYPKLWDNYSETQKKQNLLDSYNAFSYDKY